MSSILHRRAEDCGHCRTRGAVPKALQQEEIDSSRYRKAAAGQPLFVLLITIESSVKTALRPGVAGWACGVNLNKQSIFVAILKYGTHV
jgi:hypothetical protein